MENVCVKYTVKICPKLPFKESSDKVLLSMNAYVLMILHAANQIALLFSGYLFQKV